MAETQSKSFIESKNPNVRIIIPDHIKLSSKEINEAKERSEKEKKIQILFNRALTREKIAWLKITIQDTTDEKFKKLNEDRENFQNKYEKFNVQICDWLKMDKNLSVSVIERESGFDEKAKSPTWADSFMQLTSDPFDDMKIGGKWRWELYIDFFKNIPDKVISQIKNSNKNSNKSLDIKTHLSKLKSDLNNPNLDKNKIKSSLNKTINFLWKNRKEPEINLLIWNIYLDSLKNEATDEKIDSEIKKLDWVINSEKAVNRFKFLLKEKGINLEGEDHAKMALKNLQKKLEDKSNIELRTNFYVLSRYNWDNTRDKWVAHKTLYAAATATAYDLRDNKKIV